jgi:hypothetical protein
MSKIYYNICDVCGVEITKNNKLKGFKYSIARDILNFFILNDYYFSEDRLEDKICNHCFNVLKDVILKLRKEKKSK